MLFLRIRYSRLMEATSLRKHALAVVIITDDVI